MSTDTRGSRSLTLAFSSEKMIHIEGTVLQIVKGKNRNRRLAHSATQAEPLELPLGVHLGDLLTPEFISRHSRFAAEDEMFSASGFRIESAQDFADIKDADWDTFIAQNTAFTSWLDMLRAAHIEWTLKTPESIRA